MLGGAGAGCEGQGPCSAEAREARNLAQLGGFYKSNSIARVQVAPEGGSCITGPQHQPRLMLWQWEGFPQSEAETVFLDLQLCFNTSVDISAIEPGAKWSHARLQNLLQQLSVSEESPGFTLKTRHFCEMATLDGTAVKLSFVLPWESKLVLEAHSAPHPQQFQLSNTVAQSSAFQLLLLWVALPWEGHKMLSVVS